MTIDSEGAGDRPRSDARYGDTSRREFKAIKNEVTEAKNAEYCFGALVRIMPDENGRPVADLTPFRKNVKDMGPCLAWMLQAVIGFMKAQIDLCDLDGDQIREMVQRAFGGNEPGGPPGDLRIHRP